MLLLSLMLSGLSTAQQQAEIKSLPDPLSLEQAIQLLDESHPDLARAQLKVERSRVDLQDAENLNAVQVNADARLRWVDHPDPNPAFPEHEDHRLGLVLTKPLYDFGHSEALSAAAGLDIQAASLGYTDARDRHAIKVMRNYFESILADLRASRDLEAMSVAFVRMDRGQDNHELGKISDIDLFELRSRYQDTRNKLYTSEGEARSSRIALALSLNRPGQQPSKLLPPVLPFENLELLSYEDLLERVMAGNRTVQSMGRRLEAARTRTEAARAKYKPTITSTVERAEYSRDTATADRWRAGVEITVPLYDGGRSDAAVRRAQLHTSEAELNLRQMKMDLRQQVRELWEQVRALQAEGDASRAFADFRDLYLDRSRALYEMEVKTDLGDSMVEISKSQIRSAEQQFQLALALAQLNALAGLPVMDWKALTIQKPSG